ncbi:TrlF family AAA-like ATPase [Duganella radicis]|uniref:AAA family ATPase n=1 Tax=Duganella radicis TaxID=551988 RepID=A0A6L6PEQ5_9BURK|nr:AAA family ATPase [Duganella radicis]MTV37538.1 AAA family ATPase [Duganella radicis]
MTEKLGECRALASGAKFYRGDLHIHSHTASHDVRDLDMTAQAIVDTAIAENLNLIAIADHNEILNVRTAVAAGSAAGILVIPAVELSTPEGHLLCYFPTVEALERFHGRLELADRHTQNSRCKTNMTGCLDLVDEQGGFGVLAHVDGGNGLEKNDPGGSSFKQDILCHRALLGIELNSAQSAVSYTQDDEDPIRVELGKKRIERLGLGERQYLARILNSDSHTLTALGRNARNDQKLTRYKMTEPSFLALRHAFEENDSRVRLEEEVPDTTPYVLGAVFGGGFLDRQAIHFSRNLNCIIGGRGTGKSTTFEAIKCLVAGQADADVVDSEVWPNQLHLFWRDEAGQEHSLSRSMGGQLENLDDALEGPISFDIDCFSQGEASRVREQAKSDPLALMKYLDTFTGVSDALRIEAEAIQSLAEKQSEISKAENIVAQIPQTQRSLSTIQQQVAAFQAAKGSEIMQLQRSLATENGLRTSVIKSIRDISVALVNQSVVSLIEDARSFVVADGITTGSDEARKIAELADAFKAKAEELEYELEEAFKSFKSDVKREMDVWALKERPIRDDIEVKRASLEQQGVKLDMAHINKLTNDEATLKQTLANLKSWEPELKRLKAEYANLLSERWAARSSVSSCRQRYAAKATKALSEVLTDLRVKLQYVESGYAQEAVAIIAEALNWRTVSHAKARLLITALTVPGLLDAIAKKRVATLTAILTEDGTTQFTKSEAEDIITKLGESAVKASLEKCQVDDFPKLTVTRNSFGSGGNTVVQREFSQLSLGQQQSVLLALILSSDSKRPLIIDQPEDNLDSEFIFHTFVPVLRRAKERRQVIIVTHNANIAVLGDAEQLIVLKTNRDRSQIVARGSIDDISARDAACKILEGAKEAFKRRARIYGIV